MIPFGPFLGGEELEERKQIRREERLFRKKLNKEQGMNPLKEQLSKVVPHNLMPGNVGDWQEVTWFFSDKVLFDFGTNPVWGPNLAQTQSFSVSNDAAFLITHIYHKAYGYTEASELAPVQVKIVNRSSGQQITDTPIPLQNIGRRNKGTKFNNPFLVMPNSFIDVTMSSWLTANAAASVGDGRFEIAFSGFKTRIENADKLQQAVFGQKK
jgi:hypothetical protein